jgi:putative ABC transport system permease protein
VWRATLKSLLARRVRLALTALSVVLGVAFMAGTYVLTDTTTHAFDQLIAQGTASLDVVVRGTLAYDNVAQTGGGGGGQRRPFPASVLADVRAVQGVEQAQGIVSGYAQVVDPATGRAIGSFGPPTIGTSWSTIGGTWVIRHGHPPAGPDQVVLDTETADRYGITVGERVEILFQGPPREFTVAGLAGYAEADTSLFGATISFFDLPTAQSALRREGRFDEIDVIADPGTEAAALRQRIQQVLPPGVEAVTATTVAQEAQKAVAQGLGFVRTGLLVFAFVALFVGAFIIFNTFSIIVAQRTRELGLLRALGASRRQVTRSVLLEAIVVGLLASAVGVGAGILVAIGLRALMGAFLFKIPDTGLQVLARTVIVSLVLGTLVTVVSAILPSRRAAHVSPMQALQPQEQAVTGSGLVRRLATGGAVLVLGVASLLYGLFGSTSQPGVLVGVGAAVGFVGIAMLAPFVTRPLARVIGAPLRGFTGRLGRENAMRNPRRTASTAAALMIGLGLVGFVTIFASSLNASTTQALEQTLRADFILTSSSFAPFSPEVAARAQQVPGAAAVSEIRQVPFRIDGSDAFVNAVDPATIEQVTDLGVSEGSVASLGRGDILVYRQRAEEHGWAVGDRVTVEFPATGTTRLTIGGIYDENRLVNDYVISLATYAEHYSEALDSFVLVTVAPGRDVAQVQQGLEAAVKPFANIDVQNQAQFRQKQANLVNSVLRLVTVLLALAVLIAFVGIVNTLSLSIYERTREIGLLRAVGTTRRQVRTMVRREAVIVAVIGAALGVVVGVLFGWAMQQALAETGVTVLSIPYGQLAVYVVLAALAGVAAAALPARRAAKLNVLEAIAYE